ncbi:MAG TPA: redox-sensing transcriptional repressor Rex [Candidatus Omnitrophota bacterium]|nr:redox-sensing transcriptional repressor Rex [Candidatus Omnitrophota bacterium]
MKVSDRTIERLSLYYRYLYILFQQGTQFISSKHLASLVGLKPEQVRKDLSYFGSFGRTGKGYEVVSLQRAIAKILGLEQGRKVAIVGVGNLGMALAGYKGFEALGFRIVAIFDSSANKIGKKYKGKVCHDIADFKEVSKKEGVEMVILTVPSEVVQEVAQSVAAAGIKAILNFAPVNLNVPKAVKVNNIDLASELKRLSYYAQGNRKDAD